VTETYELGFLFRNNGHRWKQIQWVFRPLSRTIKPSTKPMLITFSPYVQTTDSIISILSQHINKDVGPLPPKSPASSVLQWTSTEDARYTQYRLSVWPGSTLDRPVLSRWSETATLAYPGQTTRNFGSGQAKIQSQIITSNSRTLKFSLPNLATWTRSS